MIYDALTSTVMALGGYKKVAGRLWPEKTIEDGAQRLRHALIPDRRETLTPEQVLLIIKWGAEVGNHDSINYIVDECNYERPRYRPPEEVKAEIEKKAALQIGDLKHLLERWEAINNNGARE